MNEQMKMNKKKIKIWNEKKKIFFKIKKYYSSDGEKGI